MRAATTAEDVSEFSLTLAKGLASSERDCLDPPDLASLYSVRGAVSESVRVARGFREEGLRQLTEKKT
jgi:hypothetical protein